MENTNYKMKQSRFYLACKLILENLLSNLGVFTALKPKYTATFVSDLKDEVAAAEAMPANEARALTHESLRAELIPLLINCRSAWKRLRVYIYDTYADPADYYVAAGKKYYESASSLDWEDMVQLMVEGAKFINEHKTELMANNNMPATFEADFLSAKNAFEPKLTKFYTAMEMARVGTEQKIELNNAVYAKIISVCLDGQVIFEKEEEMKKLFSFEAVSELVTPPGASGVKLIVKKAGGLPIVSAEVSVAGKEKIYVTNAEGQCEILQLGAGENTFTIEADGFKPLTVKMDLNTGTTSTKIVTMEPLFSGELNVGPVPAPTPTIVNADNA